MVAASVALLSTGCGARLTKQQMLSATATQSGRPASEPAAETATTADQPLDASGQGQPAANGSSGGGAGSNAAAGPSAQTAAPPAGTSGGSAASAGSGGTPAGGNGGAVDTGVTADSIT